jgi:hypothetical protein
MCVATVGHSPGYSACQLKEAAGSKNSWNLHRLRESELEEEEGARRASLAHQSYRLFSGRLREASHRLLTGRSLGNY